MSTKEQHNDTTDTVVEDASDQAAEQATAEAEAQNADVEEQAEDTRYAELAKHADESQQRYLRAQADFDNFRRRTAKEKEELAQYASMKLIGQLVPIVDNFERAIAAASSNSDYESLAKGVDMIFRQLSQTLEAEGLKAIESVGQPFNPEFHQAIMQVESDEHEEGIVVEEVQKGYMLKEKVLRPAMVKVSG
ncbi:nucleotide exchange factor GrpE [Paenibacillus sp. LHD-117]|uniref:nucleotide exchange factor GrpE n=1 Tax=Paenibacillus sp. LHD-117 TaxID=3071412 RepID=UPI0027E04886|nr:nucleotide exchange factor GrpE [Paenibacillus sp. LHD-117]MDQ6421137.1 nucleotide exchange factor GrpE [Paenibacillus sp. LHD-117]